MEASKIQFFTKQMYERIITNMEEFVADLFSSDSNKKPLINKLSKFKSDLKIAKNKLNEKKNVWQNQHNFELLKEGQLIGYEKVNAERGIIMNQHKETDYQGELIKEIGENVLKANKNLEGINQELNNKGNQIINVHEKANKNFSNYDKKYNTFDDTKDK